jgi:diguanylate cyclase (GGDEF)-like protein
MERLERPEYAIFGAWLASEVIIAASVALSGGPTIATMSWFAIPLVTLSARFSVRGIVVGVAATLALLLAVAFGVDAQAVVHNPPLLLAPLGLVIAIAILSTALMRSDVDHRSEAVIDPLTGLLNRNALARRVNELQQQSEVSGEQVGVILGDLDDFKLINDAAGHAAGDGVLKDVAGCLRKELRAFDLAYRFGGEEFIVLVPGADAGETSAIAERLRAAVRVCSEALPVTMSVGTSTSAPGARFDFDRVCAEADRAMYEAKGAGGDRVRRSHARHAPGSADGQDPAARPLQPA